MTREAAVVALMVLAPAALVLLVALLRGYDIHLTIRRRRDRGGK